MKFVQVEQRNQTSKPLSALSRLTSCVRQALIDINSEESMLLLLESKHWLEAVPLSTSEFDLADRRLSNAQRYLDSGENGAAHYELRLLLGGLIDRRSRRFWKRRRKRRRDPDR